jgi:glycopeptide antibiotics resistance protein
LGIQADAPSVNLTPFLIISSQIENYLYGTLPLSHIIVYLCSRILLFVPYGFYCALISRRASRLLRLVILLFFPVILEVLQYFFYPTRCDIDDVIYAFIGGLLGCLIFFLTNLLFRLISGKNFLEKDIGYRFSSSSLHF